jgi:hypothetical protein
VGGRSVRLRTGIEAGRMNVSIEVSSPELSQAIMILFHIGQTANKSEELVYKVATSGWHTEGRMVTRKLH